MHLNEGFPTDIPVMPYAQIDLGATSFNFSDHFSSFLYYYYFSTSLLEYNCFTIVSFCFITKRISYTYTYIPISPPSCVSLPPYLSHPSPSLRRPEACLRFCGLGRCRGNGAHVDGETTSDRKSTRLNSSH